MVTVTGRTIASDSPEGRMGAPFRLADVLASLTLVGDLGFGLPVEEAMRSCLVSTAIARRLGLSEAETSDTYYTALLQHIGCTGFAHETSERYGDELVTNAAAARTNVADLRDVIATFLPEAARGRGRLGRARVLLMELTSGSAFSRRFATAACEVGRSTARRLDLADGVQRGLLDVFEQWNGKGGSRGLAGESIALPARITQVGGTAALFCHIGDVETAVLATRAQAGSVLDPTIVSALADDAHAILGAIEAEDLLGAVIEAEPRPVRVLARSELPAVATVFGDVADLKSIFTLGHSPGVARLAAMAGDGLGLDASAIDRLRVAALLHDLGRVGTSDEVWEHPGRLTWSQLEQVRLHPYRTERILARSVVLRPMAETAGMHHERLDGSGYHRGATARDMPLAARVLAAADAYQALTQDRPHRVAHTADKARAVLEDEVRAGRLDREAVRAVLLAAGLSSERLRPTNPAGLSERELDVLRLVARGFTSREIAERLSISRRTAEHHVDHIYTKVGVSSRAAAALFAMEHDLLDAGHTDG